MKGCLCSYRSGMRVYYWSLTRVELRYKKQELSYLSFGNGFMRRTNWIIRDSHILKTWPFVLGSIHSEKKVTTSKKIYFRKILLRKTNSDGDVFKHLNKDQKFEILTKLHLSSVNSWSTLLQFQQRVKCSSANLEHTNITQTFCICSGTKSYGE